MTDEDYLKRAIEVSQKSEEPVKCGCVIVQDDHIIAEEYNSQRADNVAVHHAEVKAVYQANRKLKSRKLVGAIVYCSCEPCVMCLVALSLAQVGRIVYSQTMKEFSAVDDPMTALNLQKFAEKYLRSVPVLEKLVIS
jgi:tRNA(Arg) A34 adenosine deaminase TadA